MIPFPARLFLHVVSVGLLVACLAYWWLDNLAHEIFGTAMFLLAAIHIVINRRWYGVAFRGRYNAMRILNTATIIGLVITMTMMLVTSILISRDVFAFASLDGAFGVREIHLFAAYWIVLIVAMHLGFRWPVVMMVSRRTLGITGTNAVRMLLIRIGVGVVAVLGIKSTFEMAFGSKLMLTYTLDLWDFNESTLGFFLNYGSIVTLVAALVYYGSRPFKGRERLICPSSASRREHIERFEERDRC
ncbi:DUF4405 domain-containing protein (plasmid) [Rhizobium sp. T1470]|uniref:DUF4405 domain-containing protein n=1 Tax=unclassified Rhizobium TaxID=2613769 RepID=UPI001AAE2B8D|nr:DUF4405 domain-containing protein [Rhizobium sp. T1473]MCA0806976.1 DUF4405 domain-containing protein [Rhizobium sp. T1473]